MMVVIFIGELLLSWLLQKYDVPIDPLINIDFEYSV